MSAWLYCMCFRVGEADATPICICTAEVPAACALGLLRFPTSPFRFLICSRYPGSSSWGPPAGNLEQRAEKRRCCPLRRGSICSLPLPQSPQMLELEEAHGGTAKKNMMIRLMLTRLPYAVFPLGSPSVSFRATRLYPPATCPLPSQSHSDSLTVPGSSAARLPQDMPNGLKVRDHDWRSASSRDSAGPWNPRGEMKAP